MSEIINAISNRDCNKSNTMMTTNTKEIHRKNTNLTIEE